VKATFWNVYVYVYIVVLSTYTLRASPNDQQQLHHTRTRTHSQRPAIRTLAPSSPSSPLDRLYPSSVERAASCAGRGTEIEVGGEEEREREQGDPGKLVLTCAEEADGSVPRRARHDASAHETGGHDQVTEAADRRRQVCLQRPLNMPKPYAAPKTYAAFHQCLHALPSVVTWHSPARDDFYTGGDVGISISREIPDFFETLVEYGCTRDSASEDRSSEDRPLSGQNLISGRKRSSSRGARQCKSQQGVERGGKQKGFGDLANSGGFSVSSFATNQMLKMGFVVGKVCVWICVLLFGGRVMELCFTAVWKALVQLHMHID
jgi:hypothetical protein